MCKKNLIINNKKYLVDSYIRLAQGAISAADEIKLIEPISINGIPYNNLIIKYKLHGSELNEHFLDVFSKLKEKNIPTFSFFIQGFFDGKPVFITENLNNRTKDVIYVSSNYHTKDSKEPVILALLQSMGGINNIPEPKPENQNSKEYYLSNNKLKKIVNIDETIQKGKELALNCYKNSILLPDDSIFYGVDIVNSKIVDLVIGDYDTVSLQSIGLTQQDNIDSFMRTFDEFQLHFVEGYKQ